MLTRNYLVYLKTKKKKEKSMLWTDKTQIQKTNIFLIQVNLYMKFVTFESY